MKRINITAGDCLNEKLEARYPDERFVPFNEAMIRGGYDCPLFSDGFIAERAAVHGVTEATYRAKLAGFLGFLAQVGEYDEARLWFGDEPFCEANAATALAALRLFGFSGRVRRLTVNEDTCGILREEVSYLHRGDNMKIVILDAHAANPGDMSWDGLRAYGELTVYERSAKEEVIPRMQGAQAIFVNKVAITAEIMDACPELRFIGVLATGFNIIDTKAAAERGIVVCNVPSYSTDSVAQLVFAHLLDVTNNVRGHSDPIFSEKRWSNCPDFAYWDFPLMELAGKTLGIIGYGTIGKAVAKIAAAFGMKVLGNSRSYVNSEGDGVAEPASLERVLAESDVISLHAPLTPDTKGIINASSIAAMKDGVILINTARGPLIVEADVAEALKAGKLRAYCADVVDKEPIPFESPLLTAPNCQLTPHLAWATPEARARLLAVTEANLKGFVEGNIINKVN